MKYTTVTFAQDAGLRPRANDFVRDKWPEFMFHDQEADALWPELLRGFADYQFLILDESGCVAALGNTIPFAWDGGDEDLSDEGWDWVFRCGIADLRAGRAPTALSALQVVVAPALRGTGVAAVAIDAMRRLARTHGLRRMLAPVRPTLKASYPLASIDDYIRWENTSGGPFDPWLRAHWRMGARIIKPARRSMRVAGTIPEWEAWTGMRFPQSGAYVVPGALQPITVDIEANHAEYIEPNVWMEHTLTVADPLVERRV